MGAGLFVWVKGLCRVVAGYQNIVPTKIVGRCPPVQLVCKLSDSHR